jgi:hypothetical protein
MDTQTKPAPVQLQAMVALRAAYASAVATIAAVEKARELFDRCQWAAGSKPFPLPDALPLTGDAARAWVREAASVGMLTECEVKAIGGE